MGTVMVGKVGVKGEKRVMGGKRGRVKGRKRGRVMLGKGGRLW